MTTKKAKQPAAKGANNNAQPKARAQPPKPKKPAFASRFVGIDSHLTERNGSTDQVLGMAAERPAGRKLAEDIARQCIQLDAEGYEIISIFPLTSGRSAKASLEIEKNLYAPLTYTRRWETHETDQWGRDRVSYEDRRYIDSGVGYSVTDGVIITAKLRK